MAEEYVQEEVPLKEKKTKKAKKYLFMTLLVLFVAFSGFLFFKYRQFVSFQNGANAAIEENLSLKKEVEKYTSLKSVLSEEIESCEELLTKEEGNFARFSYCRELLDFSKQVEEYL